MENKAIKEIFDLGFPWQTADPFLFCVHHEDFYPKGNGALGPDESISDRLTGQDFDPGNKWRMYHGTEVPGFPAHPHVGFETVTIVREGMVDHSDSLGAAGRFGNGDVQWMTAGKGVQHAEMFPLLNEHEDNPLKLFQIWLNLPRSAKKVNPHFKMLWHEDIPVVVHKDNHELTTTIEIIAGHIEQTHAPEPAPDSWAADTENEVAIWHLKMQPKAIYTLPKASAGINRNLYFFKGESIELNNQEIIDHKGISINSDQSVTISNGAQESNLLLLQGKPINEPVVQHGPFVVNEAHEINETINAFQQTQFGGWPWPSTEHTHAPDEGRFALYANGKKEKKE